MSEKFPLLLPLSCSPRPAPMSLPSLPFRAASGSSILGSFPFPRLSWVPPQPLQQSGAAAASPETNCQSVALSKLTIAISGSYQKPSAPRAATSSVVSSSSPSGVRGVLSPLWTALRDSWCSPVKAISSRNAQLSSPASGQGRTHHGERPRASGSPKPGP